MYTDYILNGTGHGPIASVLQDVRFEPNLLRPYTDRNGRRCVSIWNGEYKFNTDRNREERVYKKMLITDAQARGINSPVFNASSLPGQRAWVQIDAAVRMATRLPLVASADMAAASTYGGFDGMSKLTLEYQSTNDPGEALEDMDGVAEGRQDRSLYDWKSLPLPITHASAFCSARELATSRNTNMPFDTRMYEALGRRCGERLEKKTIGVEAGIEYGTITTGPYPHTGLSKGYGYTTIPGRTIKTNLVTPTGSNAASTISDVLGMIESLRARGFQGPYMLYTTPDWNQYMDEDYILTGGNTTTQTLRNRLKAIPDIQDVKPLYWLTGTLTMLLVRLDGQYMRMVVGLDTTTVMWEEKGGGLIKLRVLQIKQPQIFLNYAGQVPIVHATTA